MIETEQVWEEFGAALRGFIRRRVDDDHAAADLLQEVFVRIHDRLHTVSDDDRLEAWLYRIARNVVTDHYRRRTINELAQDEGTEDLDPLRDENINEQVGGWLVSRIAELPEEYREAVTLAELEEVPQAEIAKRVGLSASGAKSRVQRGRKMLKELLLRCCHFEFDRRGNVIDYQPNTQCGACCGSEHSGRDSCSTDAVD